MPLDALGGGDCVAAVDRFSQILVQGQRVLQIILIGVVGNEHGYRADHRTQHMQEVLIVRMFPGQPMHLDIGCHLLGTIALGDSIGRLAISALTTTQWL